MKSAELQAAQSATTIDTALVNRLSGEIAQLELSVSQLQADIVDVSDNIADLQYLNIISQLQVQFSEVFIHFFAAQVQGAFEIRVMLSKSLNEDNREWLDSGEQALDKLEYELLRLDKLFSEEANRLVLAKSLKRAQIRGENQQLQKDLQPNELAATLEGLLTPNLLSEIYNLVSTGEYSVEADLSSSEKKVSETSEALSLILLAEPPDLDDEKGAVSQPYLGDNLSLEGADNPQAFALLLLKERMAEISVINQLDGGHDARSQYLARFFDLESIVDEMVVKALKDSEYSEAAIRKASKA
ncbi:hypothetical protein [Endozoicomonas sp.]|uniref:hypothetical protein n=1 Tax=Endozoicomonas sp. TaxID=1892382 RepID=UPI003AF554ED